MFVCLGSLRANRAPSTVCLASALCVTLLLAACGDSGGKSDDEPDGLTPGAGAVIPRPVSDDCITDVTAGDHTFSCDDITYLVLVDEQCTKTACGLIFDIHGATMSGLQERDNTLLHLSAPKAGYIYVNPSATPNNTGGTWNLDRDPPKIAEFMRRTIKAFHVDPLRVHATGFSQGGFTTLYLLEHENDILASAAPVAGALEELTWATAAWQPRVPMLIMNGISDTASTIESSRDMVAALTTGLALTGGQEVEGDGHYSRKHWSGSDGMTLDYIEHDYGGQAVLQGHCIPGGVDLAGAPNNFGLNATTCSTGDIKLDWGAVVLKYFQEHPKKAASITP
jgi:predicted esterase